MIVLVHLRVIFILVDFQSRLHSCRYTENEECVSRRLFLDEVLKTQRKFLCRSALVHCRQAQSSKKKEMRSCGLGGEGSTSSSAAEPSGRRTTTSAR